MAAGCLMGFAAFFVLAQAQGWGHETAAACLLST